MIPDKEYMHAQPVYALGIVNKISNGMTTGIRPYMTPAIVELLAAIRLHEGGKHDPYNADFRQDDKWRLVDKPFDTVRALGRSQVTQGEPSSAIGAYQFLTKTLDGLKSSLSLKGTEIFNEELQDDLAYTLMVQRGLNSYYGQAITAENFANALAREWASLPVVTDQQGRHRLVRKGETFYAGDKLNKARHDPDYILGLVKALQQWAPVKTAPTVVTNNTPASVSVPEKSFWSSKAAWIAIGLVGVGVVLAFIFT